MGTGTSLTLSRRKVVIGLLLIVLAGLGLFIWQAVSASRALLAARDSGVQVEHRISAGDFTGAARALAELRTHTRDAHDATDGLLWDIGAKIPFIGKNIDAVQTVSSVLDDATRLNAPLALKLSEDLHSGRFRPVHGQIDLALVEQLTPDVRRAAAAIDDAGSRLDRINPSSLVFPFNDLLTKLQGQVDDARSAADATASAFGLLPDALGAIGPRNYLLVIQNPAELRSTGGLPGSIAILHADKGRITMGYQGSAANINGFTGPVVKLPTDTANEYGQSPAIDFRDTAFTPDFPEAAQLQRQMVTDRGHGPIDGVVSIDPVAMASLLGGTGPVPVAPGVTLNAGNAITVLLSQTYQSIQNPGQQDLFFQTVARKLFDAVTGGQGDPAQTVKALAAAAGQHRIQFWSADPAEEAQISGTAIAGSLVAGAGRTPHVGIYLNDSTASKMDYYLHYRASVIGVDCRADGAQDLQASISFVSTMPSNFSSLSDYILGNGQYSPRGTIQFNLRVYAPLGGSITGMEVDGAGHSVTDDQHHGRQIAFLPVSLKPGQQSTITIDLRTAAHQSGNGVLDFTPGMVSAPNGVKIPTPCS